MIEITDELLAVLKKYWKKLQKEENNFVDKVEKLGAEMEAETGIRGIDFFYDGGYCGIGVVGNPREMELITNDELEKE